MRRRRRESCMVVLGLKALKAAPKSRESMRIRETYFTEFVKRAREIEKIVPIQLSGGFRSKARRANAIDSGVTDFV